MNGDISTFLEADIIVRVLIVYRRSKLDKPIEDVIGKVIKTFKQTVFAQKRGAEYI